MKVVEVVELGLGGNALLSDIHRLHWNTASSRTRMFFPVQLLNKGHYGANGFVLLERLSLSQRSNNTLKQTESERPEPLNI